MRVVSSGGGAAGAGGTGGVGGGAAAGRFTCAVVDPLEKNSFSNSSIPASLEDAGVGAGGGAAGGRGPSMVVDGITSSAVLNIRVMSGVSGSGTRAVVGGGGIDGAGPAGFDSTPGIFQRPTLASESVRGLAGDDTEATQSRKLAYPSSGNVTM